MTSYVVHFTGPINSSTTGQLIRKCSDAVNSEASELIVKIATMGGECSYGFSLYNFLMSLPIPVHTHNLGTVESMGNIIYLAGERRTACKHSKFLFHPFHWTLHGSVDHSRMSEYAMSLDYDLQMYADIVRERTEDVGDSLDTLSYLTAAPRILNPSEAIATGLVHEVDELTAPRGATICCIHA
ncbi:MULTISPECIES: ATP-dependent Clp protease proteolytic subunit [Pseudomonas]|uniref:ATP-dependent Clp protease proteolytic subunit n=1 Tax=Pseudomonas TaxID=286 RepID=UPI00123BC1B0|nr:MULTISPECIES: ATP-dependent Clp protease proteolytic subunit [Pseudomonas]QIB50319.1 Clp protease [Pseudomonas sp. OIL-1]